MQLAIHVILAKVVTHVKVHAILVTRATLVLYASPASDVMRLVTAVTHAR